MNTFNHIKVAEFVCDYLYDNYNIKLNRNGFILGNIQPDFGINVVAKPHYIDNYLDFVKSETAILAKKCHNKKLDFGTSRRIGVLCHYCTDFFCFVHNSDFTGSSLKHVSYERKLNKYCSHHYHILNSIDFMPDNELTSSCTFTDEMLRLHKIFMSKTSSFEKDWLSSLKICILSVLFIMTV